MEVTNTGLVFLTPSTLLVSNTASASFDVLHIHPSPPPSPPSTASVPNIDTDTVPFRFCSFLLPGLPPWQQWRALAFEILDQDVDADPPTEHIFVLDRARFLPFLLAPEADSGTVLWHTCGPACTRFLDATAVSTHYITTTCGQRMIAIISMRRGSARTGNPAPVPSTTHEEEDDVSTPPFTELITSEIPYFDTTSEELFSYGAVMIDDAGIISVNFGEGTFESSR
ncbi:hypothetical protein B0H19DRAFT_1256272 [Mycena capillaripes]|nr:hypothetical protein B0H19DRAFT_1256272 [Mycena capillaripes]